MSVRIAVAIETEDAAIVAVLLEHGGEFLSSATFLRVHTAQLAKSDLFTLKCDRFIQSPFKCRTTISFLNIFYRLFLHMDK